MLNPHFSLDPTDPRYLHYGEDASSSDVDVEIADLIDFFVRAPAASRTVAMLSPGAKMMCLSYCYRQLVFAVRRHSSYCLARAVLAVIAGGLYWGREPRATSHLPVVEDAARRLGRPTGDLVDAAAAVLGDAGASSLRAWFADPDRETMESARWRVVGDAATIDYEVAGEPAP